VLIGDANVLQERAAQLKIPLKLRSLDVHAAPKACAAYEYAHVQCDVYTKVEAGVLTKANVPYVLSCIDVGTELCRAGMAHALVTCPIQKSVIQSVHPGFQGHTEYLAQLCHVDHVVMMLAGPNVRVALLTTHVPLQAVPALISAERLEACLQVITKSNYFSSFSPLRIAVTGLNPHAGESGYLGLEEIQIINPVLDAWRSRGEKILGALPADTAFTPQMRTQYDVILALYHDQGLAVVKALDFGRVVNVTLGLPILRMSVDHGTALELAGTGKANPSSFQYVMQQAHHYAQQNLRA
jgi:4-hydroxythreonine-4-phosphate dehydrogenase